MQLPEDQELRRAHAPLSTFVERALTTPLIYEPQTDWSCEAFTESLLRPVVADTLVPQTATRACCWPARLWSG